MVASQEILPQERLRAGYLLREALSGRNFVVMEVVRVGRDIPSGNVR